MTIARASLLCMLLAGCGTVPAAPDGGAPSTDGFPSADAGPPTADASLDDAGLPTPPIAWAPCPSRFRDECATVQMPLDHANPGGPTIDVFLSRRGRGTRQLWLLQGGPGASAESFFGLHDFLSMVDPELEVFTLEHRGVGDSTRLGCPSGEAMGTPGGTQIVAEEWPACEAEVRAQWGERLAFFSTTQAAHDLALAITRTQRPGQRTFIYGGSYGTYWANRYAVLHPDQPAGVILDAPVQPGSDLASYDLQFDPVGRRLFSELCLAAPRCREKLGPDPLAFFESTFQALAAGRCSELGVDTATWKTVFAISLMDYNLRNWLPALVYRLNRCSLADQDAIVRLFSNVFNGTGALPRTSRVLQVHVLLSELFPRTHTSDAPLIAAEPSARFFQNALVGVFATQDTWPRYAMDPRAAEYAPARVPILVLAGQFDPAAPPAVVGIGYRDNLRGPHQTYIEMPYGTHTNLTTSPVGAGMPACPVQLVRAFLADPTATLPVECATRVLPPTFTATEEIANRFFGTPDLYD